MGDYRLEDYYLSDDEYKCTLPEEFQKIALEELREEPHIREQAIAQMREWIAKHPFITKCRTDSAYLLRFLRTKKYSVPIACQTLEHNLLCKKLYPQWFDNLDSEEDVVWNILKSGYAVPLLERDSKGQPVVLYRPSVIDPQKHTVTHIIRATTIIFETIGDDEINQVIGYTNVHDMNGVQLAYFGLWTINDLRNCAKIYTNGSPARHRSTHFLNLPATAMMLVDLTKSMIKEKHRSRIVIHRSVDSLYEHIDRNILPKEYGGTVPMNDMLETFLKRVIERRPYIKALTNINIELDPNASLVKELTPVENELGLGIEGSFRKLNVD